MSPIIIDYNRILIWDFFWQTATLPQLSGIEVEGQILTQNAQFCWPNLKDPREQHLYSFAIFRALWKCLRHLSPREGRGGSQSHGGFQKCRATLENVSRLYGCSGATSSGFKMGWIGIQQPPSPNCATSRWKVRHWSKNTTSHWPIPDIYIINGTT